MSANARSARYALLFLLTPVLAARADFSYVNFSDTTGLQLNGDAASVASALRLSSDNNFSAGSAFTTLPVALGAGNSFSTFFQFRISSTPGTFGDDDGPGADGLVFVVQTQANNVGSAGGGIGYAGISPSVGVEFDTFFNGGEGEPTGNHVGINVNGSTASVASAAEPTRFNDSDVWSVWIDYDGITDLLEARWSIDPTRPAAAQLSTVGDLETVLGQDQGFIGFTSATGSGFGAHEILSWTFRGEFNPVPEPSTIALLAIAAGAALRRRRDAAR